jgi:hypothetical protein
MSDKTATEQATPRRTKRRYAHELYPHADEFETRPVATEVPYLYARAIGHGTQGTSWFDMREGDALRLSVERTQTQIHARLIAFLADALHQGMTGDEAWKWADERCWDYSGEWLYQRAEHYGVPTEQIKPYPCGPEPDKHDHYEDPDERGWRIVVPVQGKESECPECTEEAPEQVSA